VVGPSRQYITNNRNARSLLTLFSWLPLIPIRSLREICYLGTHALDDICRDLIYDKIPIILIRLLKIKYYYFIESEKENSRLI